MNEKQTTVTEKRYGEYYVDDLAITLRAESATCGGGSEVLVICCISKQLGQSVQEITKVSENNMQERGN